MDISTHSGQVAAIYRFCSQSMRYPESAWFNTTYKQAFTDLLIHLGGEHDLQQVFSEISLSENALEDLQIEYTRLFINGAPHVAAPPYGSVYLDKSLKGSHCADTAAFYLSRGLSVNPGGDLPDHISNQLEFLSHLAANNDSASEREFLRLYWSAWFPQFHQRVVNNANIMFYPTIVRIIDFFTKEEEEHDV